MLNQAPDQTNGTVSVIDTTSNLTVATISVGHLPHAIAVTPDDKRVYVVNGLNQCSTLAGRFCDSISVIDTQTQQTVPVVDPRTHLPALTIKEEGDIWYMLAMSPDGATLYVSGRMGGAAIDTETNTIVRSWSIGSGTEMAVDAGGKVWEATTNGASSGVYDPKTDSYTFLNLNSDQVAVSPTRSEAYFSANHFHYEQVPLDEIAIFDTDTFEQTGTLHFGSPHRIGDIAFRPDGKLAYVLITLVDGLQYYFIIDTATQKVVGGFQAGGCPCNMVVVNIPNGQVAKSPVKSITAPSAFHARHF